MKKMLMIGCLLLSSISVAQTTTPAPAAPAAPSTVLDAFLSQTGLLTVRESLGTLPIPVDYGGELSLEAVKIYTPGQEAKALMGIRIGVNDGEKYSTTRYEFIELDEIDGMIQAVRYMVTAAPKLNASVQPEMTFKSKSGVRVSLFYSNYDRTFSGSALVSTERVFMKSSSLETLANNLSQLKALLK